MMKYFRVALATFGAAIGLSFGGVPALAADVPITVTCTPDNKSCVGGYNFGPVTTANFAQGFTFTLPLNGKFGGSVTTEFTSANQNIDFTSIVIDGVHAFHKDVGDPAERWSIANIVLTGGPHRIDIIGTSAGAGEFAGTISFAAVPEPATWAMMILGFGLVGGALRRRAKPALRLA